MWRPLMDLLVGDPSLELLTVVTSTICNLLLEFSPAKEPMLESGAVEMLCELTRHSVASLRLNGSWALMNMAFQVKKENKPKFSNGKLNLFARMAFYLERQKTKLRNFRFLG